MNIAPPLPDMIRAARAEAGLTQAQAAALVHLRSWKRWQEYESGVQAIDLARWELFLAKTGQHKLEVTRTKQPTT